jgi:hypothetical protein
MIFDDEVFIIPLSKSRDKELTEEMKRKKAIEGKRKREKEKSEVRGREDKKRKIRNNNIILLSRNILQAP